MKIATEMGITYSTFLAITSGVAFMLMGLIAYRFTTRPVLVAVLYFVYPFVLDAIQARNLIAMSLVLLAFAFGIQRGRLGRSAFPALILAAATIHITMLVFLITWPILFSRGQIYSKTLAFVGALATPIVAFAPTVIEPVARFVVAQSGVSRFEDYFATRGSLGVLIFASLHAISIFVLNRANAVMERQLAVGEEQSPTTLVGARVVSFAYRAALVLTILIPLAAINSNFFRLIRNMWFIYAVAFAIAIGAERPKRDKVGIRELVAMTAIAHSLFFVAVDFHSVGGTIFYNNPVSRFLADYP